MGVEGQYLREWHVGNVAPQCVHLNTALLGFCRNGAMRIAQTRSIAASAETRSRSWCPYQPSLVC